MNQVLPYLFFLSCPLSMGLMMWFMMRGMHGDRKEQSSASALRIAQLEREVDDLRAAQPDRERVETR